MATPRYSSPAESASASRVSLASAGGDVSNAGTLRAERTSMQDGRNGLASNPYGAFDLHERSPAAPACSHLSA